jgi:RNA methyltransferase, TrmH family
VIEITSVQNPNVKEVVRLRERRHREKTDRFLIEGYRELLRAVDAGWEIESLFICPDLFLGTNEPNLIQRCGKTVFSCSETVFKKISYRDRPDGLLAVAPQKHRTLADFSGGKNTPFYVVAESIEKPGNLGTILRSSDGTGVDGLIVCDRCTDIHNPNVVRASVGTLFTVPVVEAGGEETLNWLKAQNISVLAATPSAKRLYTDVDMTRPLAIAVGTEQLGLSDLWMEQADLQVRIPMQGTADSLNVATATTLLLYEVVRQRSMRDDNGK